MNEVKLEKENVLILENNVFNFENFPDIKDIITFGLYPGKMVIMNADKSSEKKNLHYVMNLDGKRIIRDDILATILKKRGIKRKTQFFYFQNVYYEETTED